MARLSARFARDPHLLLALALILPVLLIEVTTPSGDPRLIGELAVGYLTLQLLLARLRRPGTRTWLELGRLALALAFVTVVSYLTNEDGTSPLLVLSIPIIALAAMLGGREAIVVGLAAIGAYLLPEALGPTPSAVAREREIALIATGIVLAVGSRRTVASLERALGRLRATVASDRSRARRIAALEEVSRWLAQAGPTDDALGGVMDLLVGRFGYDHVSIYLGDAERVALGAQRGYANPIHEFVPGVGVLGRVMRTRRPALVADVAVDPDYASADEAIGSLVSVPLVAAGELMGIVNVEAVRPLRLDEGDLAAVGLVADRLASALALARDRDRLAQRVTRYERLTSFSQVLSATLEPQELYRVITDAVTSVVPADAVSLTVRAPGSDEYRMVACPGGDERFVGARILPGEGMTGRAIETGELVVDEAQPADDRPRALRAARLPSLNSVVAVPLLREGVAIGALALIRNNPPRAFDEVEREMLPLIASQAALAVANAQFHHAAMEASIRDSLTGLFNRRHLDASMERLSAVRGRQTPEERRPLSLILFDLDHFGQFNKRYGHAVGDDVLRRFGQLLRERFRASDVLARFGGEEFVVLLDGANREEASRLADEIRQRLHDIPIEGPNGETLSATVSAGCAGLDPGTASLDGLIDIADVGLALAKSAGRDQVVAA